MGNTAGIVTFVGTIASTLGAYSISTNLAERVMFSRLPEGSEDYIKYLPNIAKKAAKKALIFLSIIEMIVMFFSNLFFLWIFNAILLQIVISISCKKINFSTIKIAMTNALGGAIAASVVLLVWQIIGFIPILNLLSFIEEIPLLGFIVIPSILLIFNLIFGAGLGKAVAINQACLPLEPEQIKETFDNDQAGKICPVCYKNQEIIPLRNKN